MYHRLAKISRPEEITPWHRVQDRFGEPPEPVKNLLVLLEIKLLAVARGIQNISPEGKDIVLNLAPGRKVQTLPFNSVRGAIRAETATSSSTNAPRQRLAEAIEEDTRRDGSRLTVVRITDQFRQLNGSDDAVAARGAPGFPALALRSAICADYAPGH